MSMVLEFRNFWVAECLRNRADSRHAAIGCPLRLLPNAGKSACFQGCLLKIPAHGLMIPPEITRLFPTSLRLRGATYFTERRVKVSSVTSDAVEATVEGTRPYAVTIRRSGRGRPRMSCSCPYWDTHEVCKHLWAALVAADERGFFRQGSGEPSTLAARLAAATEAPPPPPPEPDWKRRLRQLRRPPPGAEGPGMIDIRAEAALTEPLVYRLDVAHLRNTGDVLIDVRHGGKTATQRFSDTAWLQSTDPADRDISHRLLGALHPARHTDTLNVQRRFIIPPQMYDGTLRAICETGRCMFFSPAGTLPDSDPLAWDSGERWSLRFAIQEDRVADGWRLRGWLRRGEEALPVEEVPIVTQNGLFVQDHTIALYDTDGGWPLVLLLRTGGLVAGGDQLFDLAAELVLLPDAPHIELPDAAAIEQVSLQPVPRLRVAAPGQREHDTMLRAELGFSYDGNIVAAVDPAPAIIDRHHQRIVRRAPDAEAAARARIIDLGVRTERDWRTGTDRLSVPRTRLSALVTELVEAGWHVEADDRVHRAAGARTARVSSGIDWFDLEGGVDFGDQHVPLPRLLAALRRGERTVRLDDGSVGLLPLDWLRRYAPLAGLGASAEQADAIRFTPAQTGLLDALLATLPEVDTDEAFARIRQQLNSFEKIEQREPPAGFRGELRGYQKEALGWFEFLRRFGLGGCLADDMGLGKTVQVLAMLEERREHGHGPSLVVVPKSLVFNWQREAENFTPRLRVRDHTRPGRSHESLADGDFDLIIATYGTLRRDAPDLREIDFDYVILDEAQTIKNADTASAKAARLLRGRHRLALSGTPIENNIGELWSLFEFLNPGMLGGAGAFADFRAATAGDDVDLDARQLLARGLRPFLLRRTKQQVAPELPPKIEQTLIVELEPEQRALYDTLRAHYREALLGQVDRVGVKKSRIQILEALLRLRQAACHPRLIDPKRGPSSAKLSVLLDHIHSITAEGHRALVFSQFTQFLKLVRERLDREGIPYEYLDGRTRDRQARVERFQNDPDIPLFLISLRAGGHGLNLTAADYVFVLDPWWNPAVEAQAIDRTHRIGQERHVIALRLIARDTVEEKVLELQNTKRELADAILGADKGLIAKIEREDLELLLG
jgi:superfamily II DNA or RNA helicase